MNFGAYEAGGFYDEMFNWGEVLSDLSTRK